MSQAPRFSQAWYDDYQRKRAAQKDWKASRVERDILGVKGKTSPNKAQQHPATGKKERKPNGTEARFKRDYLTDEAHYEGITFRFRVGGKSFRYTPDWVAVDEDGTVHCYEVKGAHHFPSEGRARLAFEMAAGRYPFFKFYWVRWMGKGKGWRWE